MPEASIEVRKSTDIVAIDELERSLRTGEAPNEVERDPEEVGREIIAQLLDAATDAELERTEAEGWSNYLGVPMQVHSFVWRPSAYNEGQPVFLVVRAIDPDGNPHVLTTGAGQVMAQLVNLAKRNRLPVIRELDSSDTNTPGRTVYFLRTPEAVRERERAEADQADTTTADA